jgi:hypothetical protein
MEKFEGLIRGEGLSRARWFSICSAHHGTDLDCPSCMTGQYVNDFGRKVDTAFYRAAPRLWRLWVNRPNSPTRRFLEEVFPNLKDASK